MILPLLSWQAGSLPTFYFQIDSTICSTILFTSYSHTKLKVPEPKAKIDIEVCASPAVSGVVAILFHNHNRSRVWSSKATNPADLLIIFECNNLDPYAYMAQQRLFGSLAITYGNNGSKVTTLHRGPD